MIKEEIPTRNFLLPYRHMKILGLSGYSLKQIEISCVSENMKNGHSGANTASVPVLSS